MRSLAVSTVSALTTCACILASLDCAAADTLSTFTVGNWSAGAFSASGTTTFDHCAGQATYRNRIVVVFEVGSNYQWSMGLQNPAWQLAVGQSYPIAFMVDADPASPGLAVAVTTNQIQIQLPPNAPLFERFMRGQVLRVDAALQNFTFDLTNVAQLLPALLRCAQSYIGSTDAANPFAVPGQP